MVEKGSNPEVNGINEILDLYKEAIAKISSIEELDLINLFFQPLRTKINEGRYDYKLVKAVYSATNLLDLKIQTLLDRALKRKGFKEPSNLDSKENTLSATFNLSRPIQPLDRPLIADNIVSAYVELMIHRKKRGTYEIEPNKMSYDPVEIEPISITEDKDKLLQEIQLFKQASIELQKLLKVRTWQEVAKILTILLHLAHEGKIKLRQENFPNGKIIITYRGRKN